MSNTNQEQLNIYQKLAAIIDELGAIKATGKHTQGWKFIEYDEILGHYRPLAAKYGVVIIPKPETVNVSPVGDKAERAEVRISFTVINANKPDDRIEVESWPGAALDYSDKAIQKAQTMCLKTFLMKLLLISDSDPTAEVSGTSYQDDNRSQQPRQQPNQGQRQAQRAAPAQQDNSRKPGGLITFPEKGGATVKVDTGEVVGDTARAKRLVTMYAHAPTKEAFTSVDSESKEGFTEAELEFINTERERLRLLLVQKLKATKQLQPAPVAQ